MLARRYLATGKQRVDGASEVHGQKVSLRSHRTVGRQRSRHGHVESGSEPACWRAEADRRKAEANQLAGEQKPTAGHPKPARAAELQLLGHRTCPSGKVQGQDNGFGPRLQARVSARASGHGLGSRPQVMASACASGHGLGQRLRTRVSARVHGQKPRPESQDRKAKANVHDHSDPDGNIRPTGKPHPRVQLTGRWLLPRSLLRNGGGIGPCSDLADERLAVRRHPR
jgi:hypothetical protein